MRTPFFGSSYVSGSRTLADQRLVNLYAEFVETKSGKAVGAFFLDPGLTLYKTVGSGPIRGLRSMGSNALGTTSQLVVVSGSTVYLVIAGAVTLAGNMSTGSGPVSMIDNGVQCAIFDGVKGYLVTAGGGFSIITMPGTGPFLATYQDGFGLVNSTGTQLWYQSNLADLSTWNALNFTSADSKPDNVVSLIDLHRTVYVLKQYDTEFWINAGLNGFAFQRLDGTFLEMGCAAAFSPALAGEAVIWLAQNLQGQGIFVMAQGYQPRRISTHAIETAIAGYSTISDAIAFAYVMNGHIFYQCTFPTANATWVYDVTSSQLGGVPMWHEKASTINGSQGRHLANCFTYYGGLSLVGDYSNGNIYELDPGAATDNGTFRKWVRSWRALPQPTDQVTRFNSLRIDMDTGLGVTDGSDPQVQLRWSDDGANTWSDPRIGSAGRTGQFGHRVKFNRLGSTKRNAGLDRIFELSSSDRFKVGLIGAVLG